MEFEFGCVGLAGGCESKIVTCCLRRADVVSPGNLGWVL